MSKMRDGPAKNAVKQKALRVLKQKKQYEVIILVNICLFCCKYIPSFFVLIVVAILKEKWQGLKTHQ